MEKNSLSPSVSFNTSHLCAFLKCKQYFFIMHYNNPTTKKNTNIFHSYFSVRLNSTHTYIYSENFRSKKTLTDIPVVLHFNYFPRNCCSGSRKYLIITRRSNADFYKIFTYPTLLKHRRRKQNSKIISTSRDDFPRNSSKVFISITYIKIHNACVPRGHFCCLGHLNN